MNTMMSQTQSRQRLIDQAWDQMRRNPAWLTTMETIFSMTDDEVQRVEELEDRYARQIKETRSWVKTLNREYEWGILGLDDDQKILALSKVLSAIAQEYEEAKMRDRPSVERLLILSFNDYQEKSKALRSLLNARAFRDGKMMPGSLTDSEIVAAREGDMASLVGSPVGSMIACIYHDDKTPSMKVNRDYLFCFSCNKSADIIDFVMRKEGLNFVEAVKYLNKTENVNGK